MKGHRELIAMRRAGYKPEFVHIVDFPSSTDWAKWGETPLICVDGDTPELEDFRFLVGTTVMVDGENHERLQRISKACSAHAKRVIAHTHRISEQGKVQLISITDTDGALTWQL